MEHHSQADNKNDPSRILEGQLRECYGRVVYSHKAHEKCADILLIRMRRVKLWQIILSAVTTGGFIAAVFGAGKAGALVGILVSTSLLALNAYTKNYDLGELVQKHKQTANDLWIIREKYLSLLVDLRMNQKLQELLLDQRDKLVEEIHSVYSGALSTTIKAYRKAQEALKKQEDMTFSDAEIDDLLPQELKRANKAPEATR